MPYLGEVAGAKAPMRVPVWLGRLAVSEVGVRWMTGARGSSNSKAKRQLDWQPAWSSWRGSFRYGLTESRQRDQSGKGTSARSQ